MSKRKRGNDESSGGQHFAGKGLRWIGRADSSGASHSAVGSGYTSNSSGSHSAVGSGDAPNSNSRADEIMKMLSETADEHIFVKAIQHPVFANFDCPVDRTEAMQLMHDCLTHAQDFPWGQVGVKTHNTRLSKSEADRAFKWFLNLPVAN